MRRPGADRRTARLGTARRGYVDPAVTFAANHAWRAADVTVVSGTVTAWNPYRGVVALGTVAGAQQAAPVADSRLNNRPAAPWATAGEYKGVIPSPGEDQTMAFVGYVGGTNQGMCALTNAAAPNSGTALVCTSGFRGRRLTDDVGPVLAPPRAVVMIAVFTGAQCRVYVNSTTPTVGSNPIGPYSQQTFVLGSVGSLVIPLVGAIAQAALWARALSDAECVAAMKSWGSYYNIGVS